MTLKIRKTDPRAQLPVRSTSGSAGMDLHALLDAPLTIHPGELVSVSTGIAIGLPSPETVGLIFARSGLAVKHGIALSNGVGSSTAITPARSGWGLSTSQRWTMSCIPANRIAQLAVLPVCLPDIAVVDALEETERGAGGFGSTGRL